MTPPSFSLLKTALTNVNNLTNKIPLPTKLCHDNNLNILCITETWLTQHITNPTINISGYTVFRSDSPTNDPKHGVCFYIKNSLQVTNTTDTFPNTLALHLHKHNVYILLVYRPPSNTQDIDTNLLNYITNFSLEKELLLLGDFNLPSILWNEPNPTIRATRHDIQFCDTFQLLGLNQWVYEPTFVSSGNTLDLILTTEPDRIMDVTTNPPLPQCGHVIVMFSYLFQNWHTDTSHASNLPRNWAKGNYVAIRSHLREIDWGSEQVARNVDGYNFITNTLQNLSAQYIPTKTPLNNGLPWLKKIPKGLSKLRCNTWKVYKEMRRQHGRTSHQAKEALFHFRTTNIQLKATSLSLQCDYEQHLITQHPTKQKVIHNYLCNKKVSFPHCLIQHSRPPT